MAKIDLTSAEWLELVFQGKNKQYGAYQMRKGSDKRHNRAVIMVCIFTVLALILPKLIEMVKPKEEVSVVDVTELAKLNEPEKKEEIKKPLEVEPPKEQLKNSIKFVPPVIKKDEEVKETEEIKKMDDLKDSKLAISTQDITNGSDNGKLAEDIPQQITEQPKVEEKVYDFVEQTPQFPGGEGELMGFINKNIKYPEIAKENRIQGRVVVQFVVGKDGKVRDVKVLRPLDDACDKEAVRVVRLLPDFIPGRQNGQAVSVSYKLPISFKLAE